MRHVAARLTILTVAVAATVVGFSGATSLPNRPIYLAADWYVWECGAEGTGLPGKGGFYNYSTWCVLVPDIPGHAQSCLPVDCATVNYFWLPGGGNVTWESRLDPIE